MYVSKYASSSLVDNPSIANPSYTVTTAANSNGKRRFKIQQQNPKHLSNRDHLEVDTEQPEEYLTPSPSQRNLSATIDHEVEEVIYNDNTGEQASCSLDIYDEASTVASNQGTKKKSPAIVIHRVDEVVYNDNDSQPSYDYPKHPTTENGEEEYNYVETKELAVSRRPQHKHEVLSSVYSYAGEDLVAASLPTSPSTEPDIYSSLHSNSIPGDLVSGGGATALNNNNKHKEDTENQEIYSKLNH